MLEARHFSHLMFININQLTISYIGIALNKQAVPSLHLQETHMPLFSPI
jgi:hypothetical protein